MVVVVVMMLLMVRGNDILLINGQQQVKFGQINRKGRDIGQGLKVGVIMDSIKDGLSALDKTVLGLGGGLLSLLS